MVGVRTLFIMGDLDLHLQGHDYDVQGHNTVSATTPERFKPHSHTRVGAPMMSIISDLDLHLQGHDLDPQSHDILLVL